MKRVTGVGGLFFKCDDPKKQKEWYRDHLGIATDEYGGVFEWRQAEDTTKAGFTAFSTFAKDSNDFAPSKKDFMFNFRVENLAALLEQLKKEGIQQVGEIAEYDYGKFGWILDPEGNKIELWEPKDEVFQEYYKDKTTK